MTLIQHPSITPVNGLFHGSKVIWPFDCLHMKMPIIFLSRFGIPKYDNSRDRKITLYIGVIKTLDMPRKYIESEVLLYLKQQTLSTNFGFQRCRLQETIVVELGCIL